MSGHVVVTVGASGSGKSRLCKGLIANEGYVSVCPDDIRRELTGDVSDQSKNAEVFRLAFERLAQHVEAGDDVVFDSTGTRKKTRLQIISTAKKANPDCKLHLAVLMDSMNPDLCRARVAKDIEEGVDRSNTLNPMDAIIERQSDAFAAAIKEIASENWDNIQLLVPTEPA